MKTPEQLKGAIRNIASKKNLRPQEVLQMFLFWISDNSPRLSVPDKVGEALAQ